MTLLPGFGFGFEGRWEDGAGGCEEGEAGGEVLLSGWLQKRGRWNEGCEDALGWCAGVLVRFGLLLAPCLVKNLVEGPSVRVVEVHLDSGIWFRQLKTKPGQSQDVHTCVMVDRVPLWLLLGRLIHV